MKNPFQRQDSTSGSFLPEDYVSRKVELRANLICLTLFGVVMFGVVGAFFVTNRQWLNVRAEQEMITVQYTDQAQKIEQLKKLEKQKSEMINKAAITTALIEKVPRSVLLAELVGRMPSEITLLELKLESKRLKEEAAPATTAAGGPAPKIKNISSGPAVVAPKPGAKPEAADQKVKPPRFEFKLKISGVARSNNEIADYMAGLHACALLEKVELKHIKGRIIDKVELREFLIEAAIRPDADARGLEPVLDLKGGPGRPATISNADEQGAAPGRE